MAPLAAMSWAGKMKAPLNILSGKQKGILPLSMMRG